MVWGIVLAFASLLLVNAGYYNSHPNQMTVFPEKLSLINQHTGAVAFVEKENNRGKGIISKMYGSYSRFIQGHDYLLSTPKAAEFTLPQFEEHGNNFILREHPRLRYELWKNQAPDVILLGSSIFFCAFNRPAFHERYINLSMLDFTTGNNTPYIADYFMSYADSIGCRLKPNTVVLYGLNRVELFSDYKDSNTHDYVKQTILRDEQVSFGNCIASFLKIPELRYNVTTTINERYNRVFRSSSVYRKEVANEHLKDEESFVDYIKSIAPANNTVRKFDNNRITKLVALNNWLASKGCKLYVLKLPQSLYNDIVLNTVGQSYYDEELKKLKEKGVDYIDVSDLKSYNISQLDYIWPNSIFDPEHLNVDGAQKFTKALMNNLLDSLLVQEEKY